MYDVEICTDNGSEKWQKAHNPREGGTAHLLGGTLTLVYDGISDFQFSMPYGHPLFDKILPMKSRVRVTDLLTGAVIFTGRILDPTNTMDSTGVICRSFVAESELALLCDTVQRQNTYILETPAAYMQRIIRNHNVCVSAGEVDKSFALGSLPGSNTPAYWHLTNQSSYDSLMEHLVKPLGGRLAIEYRNNGRYLNFMQKSVNAGSLGIRLAQNLLSIEEKQKPSQLVTRLIPLGAEYESYDDAIKVLVIVEIIDPAYNVWWMQQVRSGDVKWLGQLLINLTKLNYTGSNTVSTTAEAIEILSEAGAINTPGYWEKILQNLTVGATLRNAIATMLFQAARRCNTNGESPKHEMDIKRRLDIQTISGVDYMDDTRNGFVTQYGIVEGTVVWDDVTDPQELYNLGRAWLQNQPHHSSITLSAVEVEETGESFSRFEVGKTYTATHAPLGINREYLVTQKVIHILESHDSTLTFGDADARITSTR